MPNWCSNRIFFWYAAFRSLRRKRLAQRCGHRFIAAHVESVQRSGGGAGLLQTTEDVRFEPCPGLTAAGRGVVSPENIAFTRWLTHLQDERFWMVNCLMP